MIRAAGARIAAHPLLAPVLVGAGLRCVTALVALGFHARDDYFHVPINQAIQRCRTQIEVAVNLPWAHFDLGDFNLYLGDPRLLLGLILLAMTALIDGWIISRKLAKKP